MSGKVTLVGAGPGDPGLLTLKGLAALSQAEVVVYDRLVSPAILAMIPPEARTIDVGKEAAHHKVPQQQINRILLEEALAGRNVVRLKGGDPFVFGRGGEELEALAAHGVPFEEVPGVTSAVAAPAYAGIPVTHRDYGSSVHIITGHQRSGRPLIIDFEALVRSGGTLVFLMGVAALPALAEGLLQAGMAPDTPAAAVENGTTSAQRRCDATLRTLPERSAAMGIRSPAVIVVGEVCALAPRLCWFDRLPLRGQRILVTRPRDRAGALSEKLRSLGAEVWEYPCIETEPILPCPAMTAALARLADYRWLVFTSPAGVEALRAELRRMGGDSRSLARVKLAAIGPGTARALEAMGLAADYIPPVYDAAHLGESLPAGGRVLLLRAEEGSPALTAALARRAISYDDIAVYRTVYQNPHSEALRSSLESGEVPLVTFTSASTVRGLLATVGGGADLSRVTGLCIGERTAAEARKHGIAVEIAREATVDALADLALEAAARHDLLSGAAAL